MYHISKDKRAYNSADKISSGLMGCLEDKNFVDITISDIQKISGVSRATFYRLFDNTIDVLSYLCDKVFISAGREFAKIQSPTPEKTMLCFIKQCMQEKDLLRVVVESNRFDILYNAHLKFMGGNNIFFHKFNFTQEQNSYMMATLTACMSACVVAWVKNGGRETPEEIYKHLKECFQMFGELFK